MAMNYSTDINGNQKTCPNDFGDPWHSQQADILSTGIEEIQF